MSLRDEGQVEETGLKEEAAWGEVVPEEAALKEEAASGVLKVRLFSDAYESVSNTVFMV